MADDKLKGFKIGDMQRPKVRATKRTEAQAEEAPEAESVGFPAIESRLEKGTAESVADELRPSYEKLETLATGGDMKKRGQAKKALAAYERTADLFEYLFATKSQLAK